jgi:hypothetical protein
MEAFALRLFPNQALKVALDTLVRDPKTEAACVMSCRFVKTSKLHGETVLLLPQDGGGRGAAE